MKGSSQPLIDHGETEDRHFRTTTVRTVKVKQMREVKMIRKEVSPEIVRSSGAATSKNDSTQSTNIFPKEADPNPMTGDKKSSTKIPLLNFGRVYNYNDRTSKPLHSLLAVSKDFFDGVNSSEPLNATQAKLRALEVGKVQVRMQNTSTIEGGATKLIYSVHLGGEPVPAASAARDMALLSEQEVALELGAPVIIQSERELKNP